jgi:hypothetical protein
MNWMFLCVHCYFFCVLCGQKYTRSDQRKSRPHPIRLRYIAAFTSMVAAAA